MRWTHRTTRSSLATTRSKSGNIRGGAKKSPRTGGEMVDGQHKADQGASSARADQARSSAGAALCGLQRHGAGSQSCPDDACMAGTNRRTPLWRQRRWDRVSSSSIWPQPRRGLRGPSRLRPPRHRSRSPRRHQLCSRGFERRRAPGGIRSDPMPKETPRGAAAPPPSPRRRRGPATARGGRPVSRPRRPSAGKAKRQPATEGEKVSGGSRPRAQASEKQHGARDPRARGRRVRARRAVATREAVVGRLRDVGAVRRDAVPAATDEARRHGRRQGLRPFGAVGVGAGRVAPRVRAQARPRVHARDPRLCRDGLRLPFTG